VVVTGKLTQAAPPGTVTEAGTVTDGRLLVRVTTCPPVGAVVFKDTVPVETAPPFTVAGLTVTEAIFIFSMMMLAEAS
jgi:hypothetical protein